MLWQLNLLRQQQVERRSKKYHLK